MLKRVLVGRAVASDRLEYSLLPKVLALPVFSSDALSSVAYATEEILRVLLIASVGTVAIAMPISLAIGGLLIIVVSSYRQTVRAYPSGGGAYIVSKDNLGVLPGLIAAAALLTDYVLTVSVSVVAGVFAMISALPSLAPFKVELSVGFVLLITLANLRGVRESGTLFAIPTYAFIVSIFILVTVGMARCIFGGCPVVTDHVLSAPDVAATTGSVGLFVILHAFSSGSTALTGVEAISNGVPAFRRPQSKNASETLLIMGIISVTMFLGISYLATHISGITVSEERSVVGQIAHAVLGGGFFFYFVQFFTTAILVLAANTSYQDFPRLSSILARDRFMPRQFANRGDRLVFSNGVIILAVFASLLIVVFDADLNRLIQLYVVGVFTSFTLVADGHGASLAEGEAQGRGRDEGMAAVDRDQRDRRSGHVPGLDHRDLHEIHRRGMDRDPRDPDHRPDVLLDPSALHRDHDPAAARHGDARRRRREPRRPVGTRPGALDGRGARIRSLVPAAGRARAVSGRGRDRSPGGPGPLARVRRRRPRPGATSDAG